MLVLSRRVGEALRIGPDITVTVVGVKGGYLRIGIEAPANVPVHREELYERIHRGTAGTRVNDLTSSVQLESSCAPRPAQRQRPGSALRCPQRNCRGMSTRTESPIRREPDVVAGIGRRGPHRSLARRADSHLCGSATGGTARPAPARRPWTPEYPRCAVLRVPVALAASPVPVAHGLCRRSAGSRSSCTKRCCDSSRGSF